MGVGMDVYLEALSTQYDREGGKKQEWKCIGQWYCYRGSALYERICNGAGRMSAGYGPSARGLPPEPSSKVQEDFIKEKYYHTITWYSYKEIENKVIGWRPDKKARKAYDLDNTLKLTSKWFYGDEEEYSTNKLRTRALAEKFGEENFRFVIGFSS